jgi:hypothetical protein
MVEPPPPPPPAPPVVEVEVVEVAAAQVAEPEPEPRHAPEPARKTALTVPLLHELERLVASAGADSARAAEWRWYLFYLRQFARIDGSLPTSFGPLVDTVFGPLLSAEPVQVRIH